MNHLRRRTIERPGRSTGSLRSRPPSRKCFPSKQEAFEHRQNLERGGVSEQGLTGAENRWHTDLPEAETTQPSPIVGSQDRSAEELPHFPPLRGGKPPREAPENMGTNEG